MANQTSMRPTIGAEQTTARTPPCPVCRSYCGRTIRWRNADDISLGYDLIPCHACADGKAAWSQLVEAARLNARLDDGMHGQTFESFDAATGSGRESSYKAARSFATTPRGVLYLGGTPGTGKTHLMAAIANALLSYRDGEDRGLYLTRPMPLYIVSSRYIEFAQRAAFERGAEQKELDRRFQDSVLDAGVLLIDDVGAERDTSTAQEKLFNLIDYRYANGRPTVIASNLRPDDPKMPPRLKSRLLDKARCRIVICSGGDYRQSQARRQERDPWDIDDTAGDKA